MKLDYYVYVSDAKVEMLFDQIPRSFLSGTAGELKVNLGIVTSTLKQDSAGNNRFTKLKTVRSYIEQHFDVGTIDQPGEYFAGTISMRWGPYHGGSELVYFGGRTADTILGLGGSAGHVLGARGISGAHSHSATPILVSVLCEGLGLQEPDGNKQWAQQIGRGRDSNAIALDAVELATTQMQGPEQTFEFLAKKLLFGSGRCRGSRQILLGTPLYVSMVE